RGLTRVYHPAGHLVRRPRPDGDDALVALLLGHQSAVVLATYLRDLVLVSGEDLLLVTRRHDVVLRDRDARTGREAERHRLDDVERGRDRVRAVVLDEIADEGIQLALAEG